MQRFREFSPFCFGWPQTAASHSKLLVKLTSTTLSSDKCRISRGQTEPELLRCSHMENKLLNTQYIIFQSVKQLTFSFGGYVCGCLGETIFRFSHLEAKAYMHSPALQCCGKNTYLLLDVGSQTPQDFLEIFVVGLNGGTPLDIFESLVQLTQLLQCLAAPVQGFDIWGIDVNC